MVWVYRPVGSDRYLVSNTQMFRTQNESGSIYFSWYVLKVLFQNNTRYTKLYCISDHHQGQPRLSVDFFLNSEPKDVRTENH